MLLSCGIFAAVFSGVGGYDCVIGGDGACFVGGDGDCIVGGGGDCIVGGGGGGVGGCDGWERTVIETTTVLG